MHYSTLLNSPEKHAKACSSKCRRATQAGLVVAAVVGVFFVTGSSLPQGHHTFIAPAPLHASHGIKVTGHSNHNSDSSFQLQGKFTALAAKKGTKVLSTPERNMLEYQKEYLDSKLQNVTFHPSLHVGNKSDLIPAEGGHTVQNLIVSTWRSGSSYLASVVATNPGTFLLYEPFMAFGSHPKEKTPSSMVNFLSEIFNCNFADKGRYFNVMKKKKWAIALNAQFWPVCKELPDICMTESYHEAACEVFPFLLVKTVRLWLNATRPLLEDENLQLRVLLLVRDPRGSMASRYRAISWCKPNNACGSVEYLCDFLEANYYATQQLMALFPGRVKVVRYEDIMLDPYTTTRDIFDFFRLVYGEEVHSWLQKEDRYSEYASVTPKKGLHYWTEELTFKQVSHIQSQCGAPLKLYGYKTAHNATHLLDLDPLDIFTM